MKEKISVNELKISIQIKFSFKAIKEVIVERNDWNPASNP